MGTTTKKEKTVRTPDASLFMSQDGTVEVSVHRPNKGGLWWVAVWGPDDIGWALHTVDCNAAYELYAKINDGITAQTLRSWGFQQS